MSVCVCVCVMYFHCKSIHCTCMCVCFEQTYMYVYVHIRMSMMRPFPLTLYTGSCSQELLSLFGLPYILSPMEAEAQCAFLDHTHQTDGSITDDSDVFLFGGQRTYRHFFSQDKEPAVYDASEIKSVLGIVPIFIMCTCIY